MFLQQPVLLGPLSSIKNKERNKRKREGKDRVGSNGKWCMWQKLGMLKSMSLEEKQKNPQADHEGSYSGSVPSNLRISG